jgi:uncharacterized protein
MRRPEREITDRELIDDVLRRGQVLYLAMCDGDMPYVIPLSYGFDGEALYVHCAPEGRKLDILRRASQVCFAITPDHEVIRGEKSCGWSVRFRSVVGEGSASVVDDPEEKVRGLDALMRQHGGAGGDYTAEAVAQTAVLRIAIISLSGKQSGY